jgi:DNA-binding transcriptional MerR regulator
MQEEAMPEKKTYGTSDALKLIGINKRKLALWENDYRFFSIKRTKNKATGTNDRNFSDDDIQFLIWLRKQFEAGVSSDAIHILIEYYTKGKIVSIKWYK